MQISTTRHSSRGSVLGTASRLSFGIGSGVLNVATCTGVSSGATCAGGPAGSGSGAEPSKAALAMTDFPRPSAIGAASVFSVPDEPKSASPPATAQPAKATVPYTAKVANRRGVIMPPPPAPTEPSPAHDAMDDCSDQAVIAQGRKPQAMIFSEMCCP